jgi:hypothetical protein
LLAPDDKPCVRRLAAARFVGSLTARSQQGQRRTGRQWSMKVDADPNCDSSPGAGGACAGRTPSRRWSLRAAMAIAQSGECGNPWGKDDSTDPCCPTADQLTVLLSSVQGHTARQVLHYAALCSGRTGSLAQGRCPRDAPRRGLSQCRRHPVDARTARDDGEARSVRCPGTGGMRLWAGNERSLPDARRGGACVSWDSAFAAMRA